MEDQTKSLAALRYGVSDPPSRAQESQDLTIQITDVRGTAPTVAIGAKFVVRADYKLQGTRIGGLVVSGLGRSCGQPAELTQGAGTFEATAEILAVQPGKEQILDIVIFDSTGTELGVHTRIALAGA